MLALYHDQGLIAVKTASFGAAANWTLGLPWLRTSVDHGTAYDLAGTGRADVEPLRHVVATTLRCSPASSALASEAAEGVVMRAPGRAAVLAPPSQRRADRRRRERPASSAAGPVP